MNNKPLLAEFGVTPAHGSGLPTGCVVDRKTNMLHRSGSNLPFIEELFQNTWHIEGLEQTVQTCSVEPDDPDLIRSATHFTLDTLTTKDFGDPADPDVIRAYGISALDTLITRTFSDPSDPDTMRVITTASFDTILTLTETDPEDPDLVRM